MLEAAYDNPFRAPAWRWLRAAGHLDRSQPGPSRRRDGDAGASWIRRAARFQRSFSRCATPMEQLRLSDEYPDIFWAHHIYDTSGPARWHVEAYLLARADDWATGFSAGVSHKVVAAYEALFFNVRERLQHMGYVLHGVLGEAIQRGLHEREYDLLWKLYGYFYGPHVLDALISKFVSPGWCSSTDGVNAAIQDDAISTLKLKAALAAKLTPVNQHNQIDLLHIFTKFVEVERTTDSAGKAQGQILDHIAAMMSQVPFTTGGHDPHTGHAIRTQQRLSVELTYDEQLAASAGLPIARGAEVAELSRTDDAGRTMAFPLLTASGESS